MGKAKKYTPEQWEPSWNKCACGAGRQLYLGPGVKATSNAEQVRKIRRILK